MLNSQANTTMGLENCICDFVMTMVINMKEKDMEELFNKTLISSQNVYLFV